MTLFTQGYALRKMSQNIVDRIGKSANALLSGYQARLRVAAW